MAARTRVPCIGGTCSPRPGASRPRRRAPPPTGPRRYAGGTPYAPWGERAGRWGVADSIGRGRAGGEIESRAERVGAREKSGTSLHLGGSSPALPQRLTPTRAAAARESARALPGGLHSGRSHRCLRSPPPSADTHEPPPRCQPQTAYESTKAGRK